MGGALVACETAITPTGCLHTSASAVEYPVWLFFMRHFDVLQGVWHFAAA